MLRRRLNLVALVLCIILVFSMISSAQVQQYKIKLNLFERLVVMSLLPTEGSFSTLKIVRDLQMVLAPSEEEYKLAGLQDLEGGGVNAQNWNAVSEKEIVFGDKAKEIIVNALKKLNDSEKLRQEHFSVYEKFVLEKKEGE